MLRFILAELFIFCFTVPLYSQNFEREEALSIAYKLSTLQILSDSGKAQLVKLINENPKIEKLDILDIKITYYYYQDFLLNQPINSKLGLLEFLKIAFEEDFYKRCDEHYSFNINPKTEKIKKKEIMNLIDRNIDINSTRKAGYYAEKSIDVFKNPPYIHKERSVFGKNLFKTLQDLKSLNLINPQVYTKAENYLKSNTDLIEANLLRFLVEQENFHFSYDENKEIQIKLLRKLKNLQIISEENFAKIINSYTPFELKSSLNILDFCEQTLRFDTRKLPKNTQDYFKVIFEEFKKVLPAFDFQNLKVSILKNEEANQLINITFQVLEKYYKIENFTIYKTRNGIVFVDNFHQLINKYLQDINYKKQYFLVYDDRSKFTLGQPFPEFGFILLTKKQKQALSDVVFIEHAP